MPSRRRFLVDSAQLVAASALPRMIGNQERSQEFSYVIVGAGSSGCVLANRLSADPTERVLLIEAGGPDTKPMIQVPGKWTSLLGTDVDWNYTTEPEPGLGGRQITWPRGKTLGGSSAINAMAYVRGHQLCFDGWAKEAGSSWAYREVLPYFKRLEDNSRGQSDYRGAGGPLAVSDTSDPHSGHLAFLEAARELGFGASPTWEFDGAQQENGAGFYQKNIFAGRRHSAAAAFLAPVLTRPNLVVWSDVRVLRLVFTGTRVRGVEIARAGALERIRATREVVLAAGVIETPKILILSGVGPSDALRALGIPIVMDLPGVGSNLHDHPKVSLRWVAKQPLPPSSVSAGLFTFSGRRSEPRSPDIQFYVGRGLDVVDTLITLTVALSQPRSRGSLRLRSADPLSAPVITANYFAEAWDLDALVEGVRLAQSVAETRAYGALRGAPVDPDGHAQTTDDLRAFIRRTADTIFHPVGTCRMGTGPGAVVDPQLRVRGVESLRVADASVMPTVVNCPTHAACLLIAERAAELMARG
jgi:choline dehydrogenase